MPRSVADLVELLQLRQLTDSRFRAQPAQTNLQRVFGGQVLAHALGAMDMFVDAERTTHSLHAYFLRPGAVDTPIDYEVEMMRAGKSFTTARVTAEQREVPIFSMIASFHRTEQGLDHFDPQPEDVTPPDECPPLAEVLSQATGSASERWNDEWGALDVRFVGDSGRDGTVRSLGHASHLRAWVRTAERLPPDPRLHRRVLAYASDLTLLGASVINHPVRFPSDRVQAASIDHAMWFHREIKADEWWLYDQVSPSASAGLGMAQGRIFQAGRLAASCAQEGLIRVIDPALLTGR